MSEKQSAVIETQNAALQGEVQKLLKPPTPFTTEGDFTYRLCQETKTSEQIREEQKFLQEDGTDTNTPDFLRENLTQLLTAEEMKSLGINLGKRIPAEKQFQMVQLLINDIYANPTRVDKIKAILDILPPTDDVPAIVAALQVAGIKVAQAQYKALNTTTSEYRVGKDSGFDTTFGDDKSKSSRRQVYTEIGGFGSKINLKGEPMSVFTIKTPEGNFTIEPTAEMDLRLAQSLFNAAVSPENMIEITKLKLQMEQEKDENKKDELSHELVLKRQLLYKAILKAYDVQTEKRGELKFKDEREKAEVGALSEAIKKRMLGTKLEGKRLQNMSISEANQVALQETAKVLGVSPEGLVLLSPAKLPELMQALDTQKPGQVVESLLKNKVFDNVQGDELAVLKDLLINRLLTERSIARIPEKVKLPSLKPENITLAMFLKMGLKGTELLYRRTINEEETRTVTKKVEKLPPWLDPKIPILEQVQNPIDITRLKGVLESLQAAAGKTEAPAVTAIPPATAAVEAPEVETAVEPAPAETPAVEEVGPEAEAEVATTAPTVEPAKLKVWPPEGTKLPPLKKPGESYPPGWPNLLAKKKPGVIKAPAAPEAEVPAEAVEPAPAEAPAVEEVGPEAEEATVAAAPQVEEALPVVEAPPPTAAPAAEAEAAEVAAVPEPVAELVPPPAEAPAAIGTTPGEEVLRPAEALSAVETLPPVTPPAEAPAASPVAAVEPAPAEPTAEAAAVEPIPAVRTVVAPSVVIEEVPTAPPVAGVEAPAETATIPSGKPVPAMEVAPAVVPEEVVEVQPPGRVIPVDVKLPQVEITTVEPAPAAASPPVTREEPQPIHEVPATLEAEATTSPPTAVIIPVVGEQPVEPPMEAVEIKVVPAAIPAPTAAPVTAGTEVTPPAPTKTPAPEVVGPVQVASVPPLEKPGESFPPEWPNPPTEKRPGGMSVPPEKVTETPLQLARPEPILQISDDSTHPDVQRPPETPAAKVGRRLPYSFGTAQSVLTLDRADENPSRPKRILNLEDDAHSKLPKQEVLTPEKERKRNLPSGGIEQITGTYRKRGEEPPKPVDEVAPQPTAAAGEAAVEPASVVVSTEVPALEVVEVPTGVAVPVVAAVPQSAETPPPAEVVETVKEAPPEVPAKPEVAAPPEAAVEPTLAAPEVTPPTPPAAPPAVTETPAAAAPAADRQRVKEEAAEATLHAEQAMAEADATRLRLEKEVQETRLHALQARKEAVRSTKVPVVKATTGLVAPIAPPEAPPLVEQRAEKVGRLSAEREKLVDRMKRFDAQRINTRETREARQVQDERLAAIDAELVALQLLAAEAEPTAEAVPEALVSETASREVVPQAEAPVGTVAPSLEQPAPQPIVEKQPLGWRQRIARTLGLDRSRRRGAPTEAEQEAAAPPPESFTPDASGYASPEWTGNLRAVTHDALEAGPLTGRIGDAQESGIIQAIEVVRPRLGIAKERVLGSLPIELYRYDQHQYVRALAPEAVVYAVDPYEGINSIHRVGADLGLQESSYYYFNGHIYTRHSFAGAREDGQLRVKYKLVDPNKLTPELIVIKDEIGRRLAASQAGVPSPETHAIAPASLLEVEGTSTTVSVPLKAAPAVKAAPVAVITPIVNVATQPSETVSVTAPVIADIAPAVEPVSVVAPAAPQPTAAPAVAVVPEPVAATVAAAPPAVTETPAAAAAEAAVFLSIPFSPPEGFINGGTVTKYLAVEQHDKYFFTEVGEGGEVSIWNQGTGMVGVVEKDGEVFISDDATGYIINNKGLVEINFPPSLLFVPDLQNKGSVTYKYGASETQVFAFGSIPTPENTFQHLFEKNGRQFVVVKATNNQQEEAHAVFERVETKEGKKTLVFIDGRKPKYVGNLKYRLTEKTGLVFNEEEIKNRAVLLQKAPETAKV